MFMMIILKVSLRAKQGQLGVIFAVTWLLWSGPDKPNLSPEIRTRPTWSNKLVQVSVFNWSRSRIKDKRTGAEQSRNGSPDIYL